ncbi:hypothetical protein ACOALA_13600 [Alicyclobacillus acidoterrestris]|uniref:hypothetical protein n=1 Tax=Alicyclobacillus acidoterrestris TaxID=1450 RepID=UPI003F52F842
MAKVGDFVEITANTNEHGFNIGEVVVVVDWEEFEQEEQGLECVSVNGGEHWFVRHTDYRITDHPSEYDRLRTALDEANRTIAELEKRARESYADGYQQGRFDEDMAWLYEGKRDKTIAELRESRQVIYDRAIQHENTIAKKDAEIERLREALEALDRRGGLGYEWHYMISQALAGIEAGSGADKGEGDV